MAWPFAKKDRSTFTALVDIGTGTVTAAVIRLPNRPGECPLVVWQHATTINFTVHPDNKRLLTKVLEAVEETVAALHLAWPQSIQTVNCVLASPWYEARTSIVTFTEPEPFLVDEQVLTSIKREEVKTALQELPRPYQDIPSDQTALLEYDILALKADGYSLKALPLRPVKELELVQYTSIGSALIVRRLREILIGAGHFKEVNFHSFIFALAQAVKRVAGAGQNFLLADVTGERADFGLVSSGLLLAQANFPMASRGLVRILSESTKSVPAETKTLTRRTSEFRSPVLARAWAAREAEWLDNFNEVLAKFKREAPLPKKVYLLAETAGEKFFAGVLKQAGFRPIILQPVDWQTICQVSPVLEPANFDPGIMPLSLYLSGVAED